LIGLEFLDMRILGIATHCSELLSKNLVDEFYRHAGHAKREHHANQDFVTVEFRQLLVHIIFQIF
jgi:hypothetical protein